MEIIDQVAIVGIFVLFLISLSFMIINIQRNRRNNRIIAISPETYQIITRLIYARNVERIRQNYERKKEIEMVNMNNHVIIINPNNDITLGIKKNNLKCFELFY